MWQAYSVLSKNRKPQITSDEFLDYYNIDKSEIREFEVVEFLDFFEVSRDDLFMQTKEEVILMLYGFHLDRKAESSTNTYINQLTEENIQIVKFNGVCHTQVIDGSIDFENQILRWNNESSNFRYIDKLILYQVIKDLDSMWGAKSDEPLKDYAIELELMDNKGEKNIVCKDGMFVEFFLQILKVILEREPGTQVGQTTQTI